MSVARAKQEVPSSEFVDWIVYLDQEHQKVKIEHHYLASIAAEVRRSYAAKPKNVNREDFLFKYAEKEEPVQLSIEESSKRQKAFWGASFGMPKEKR